jgi:DNA repair protein SbcC/Rad50
LEQLRASLGRVDAVLATLPVPFDDPQLLATSRVMNKAGEAVSAAKASYVIGVRDAQSLEGPGSRLGCWWGGEVRSPRGSQWSIRSLAGWNLFVRCMSA